MSRQRLREDVRALGLFAISRVWIAASAWLSTSLVAPGPHFHLPPSAMPLEGLLLPRWDEWHYLAIAANGYEPDTLPVAFFAAYPFLFGAVARAFGLSFLWSARLVSNALGAAAFVVLGRLCRRDMTMGATTRALALVAFFPTSLYFSIGYTESLYFLCVVGVLLACRSRRWLLAGLIGYVAALTRANGLFLVIPLAFEYAQARRLERRSLIGRPLLAIALVPAGLVTFMAHQYAKTGDAFAQAHMGLSRWGRAFSWVWVTVEHTLINTPNQPFYRTMLLTYPLLPLAGIALAIRQRARLSYIAFASAMLILVTSIGYLESVGRYVLVIAPMYIAFARATQRSVLIYALLLVLFAVMLTVTTVMHVRGYFII